MSRLRTIEKAILNTYEKRLPMIGGDSPFYKENIENDIQRLNAQRRFLLDRRESWIPKTIWMVLVPIVVSIVASVLTLYVAKKLGFEIRK